MKDTYLVESFYTKVIGLINKLKSHGENINIEDKRVVEKVLRSLPHKFESLVVTFEEKKTYPSLLLMNYKRQSSTMTIELVDQIHY